LIAALEMPLPLAGAAMILTTTLPLQPGAV
jgi:hypothetical protein